MKFNRRIVVLFSFLALFMFVGSVATAHRVKQARKTHEECKTIKDKKKSAACKACITKYKGKRHYHPRAKAGSRCHE